MKRLLILPLFLMLLYACEHFDNEYDFRNYLRDKHPYSNLIKLDSLKRYGWKYIVQDTINNRTYIYEANQDNASRYEITEIIKK